MEDETKTEKDWRGLAELLNIVVRETSQSTVFTKGDQQVTVVLQDSYHTGTLYKPDQLIELYSATSYGECPDYRNPQEARELSSCLVVAAAYCDHLQRNGENER